VAGFTPMFSFISGAVNNDNLAALLCTGILLALMRLAVQELPQADLGIALWLWLQSLGLGLLLGLAALTKESGLGLLPLAGLALSLRAYRWWWADASRGRLQVFVQHVFLLAGHTLLVFGAALAVAGWWYMRNLRLYGDWLGWNAFVEVLGRRAVPATFAQLWGERAGFMQSYWGLFGGVNVPMPETIYSLLNAVGAIGAVGLLVWAAREWHASGRNLDRWAAPALPSRSRDRREAHRRP